MKNIKKILIKIFLFSLLINLPFITIMQIIGIDAFLDSFKNPDVYDFLAADIYSTYTDTEQERYILLQKTSHPKFSIEDGDTILYCTSQGKTAYNKVQQINCIGTIESYDVIDEKMGEIPVYETQVYGKVLGFVDNNPWNILSIKIWEISTHIIDFNKFLPKVD